MHHAARLGRRCTTHSLSHRRRPVSISAMGPGLRRDDETLFTASFSDALCKIIFETVHYQAPGGVELHPRRLF
jgi:hypothetical protein